AQRRVWPCFNRRQQMANSEHKGMNDMKNIRNLTLGVIVTLLLITAAGCVTEPANNSNSPSPSPTVSPSPSATERSALEVPVTLPVLDALLSDHAFRAKVKSQVALSDAEIAQLQKIAAEEVTKLRQRMLKIKQEARKSRGNARPKRYAAPLAKKKRNSF